MAEQLPNHGISGCYVSGPDGIMVPAEDAAKPAPVKPAAKAPATTKTKENN